MGSPTALDIALWQVPTKILDNQFGMGNDPWTMMNRGALNEYEAVMASMQRIAEAMMGPIYRGRYHEQVGQERQRNRDQAESVTDYLAGLFNTQMRPAYQQALPIGPGIFTEYLKGISINTGIDISIELSLLTVRSLSLTITAVALPLSAGGGSTIEARDAAIYKAGLKEAVRTGRVPAYVHGNSNNNQNPHGVYVIYKGGGIASDWEIQKYGITGNTDFPENRPQYQVNRLNRNSKDGAIYNWHWVASGVPGRQMAKMIELYHVSQYFMTIGNFQALPPLQFRPNPTSSPTFLK
ncbi:hypothetical protein [Sphingobacterium sp.]|uniref:hypothetical protein n=1 Tax=Sphingobacterium sp. TaxID=341027 RepID=UPI0028A21096|nr:hypothetical protein [Sphingobacterium sp.]